MVLSVPVSKPHPHKGAMRQGMGQCAGLLPGSDERWRVRRRWRNPQRTLVEEHDCGRLISIKPHQGGPGDPAGHAKENPPWMTF
jgi:hypothetical protein